MAIADIDECASAADTCSPFAVCNNTVGDFNCTCTDGYSGDGFNCTGKSFFKCANGIITGVNLVPLLPY